MCINYDPIGTGRSHLIGMPEPTFSVAADVFREGQAPIIMLDSNGQNMYRPARFGLVPTWVQNTDMIKLLTKYETWNAKIETITAKRSYKAPFSKSQFCLVACERVYEPRYYDQGDKSVNRWQGIERIDKQPFTIAAIYEDLVLDGQNILSFSMITTDATNNPYMSQFHKPTKDKRSVIEVPPPFRDAFMVASPEEAREMLDTWGSLSGDYFTNYDKPVMPKPKASKINDQQGSLF